MRLLMSAALSRVSPRVAEPQRCCSVLVVCGVTFTLLTHRTYRRHPLHDLHSIFQDRFIPDLYDLADIVYVIYGLLLGLDLCCTDPAQHVRTIGWDVDYYQVLLIIARGMKRHVNSNSTVGITVHELSVSVEEKYWLKTGQMTWHGHTKRYIIPVPVLGEVLVKGRSNGLVRGY